MRRPWLLAGLVSAAIAAVVLIVAIVVPIEVSSALNAGLRQQTVWQKDSPPEVKEAFLRNDHATDPPVLVDFYLFNITNLPQVRNGSKPQLAELGPYVYVKCQVKQHVSFDQDGRVHFRTYEYYLPHGVTEAQLDDTIVTANLPLLGALAVADSQGSKAWLQLLLDVYLKFKDPNTTGLFMRRAVRDLLWGYEDPLLSKLKLLKPDIQARFSLARNDSAAAAGQAGADTIVNTGFYDSSRLWDTEVWHNIWAVTSWQPPHIEAVRGTDATRFRPNLQSGDSVRVWAPDLYRAVELVAQDITMLHGVDLLHFLPDKAQGEPNPAYYQTIQGLMNVSSPTAAGPSGEPGQPGAPVYLSMAHYCNADPALADGVEGLSCNPDKHITFLDVEPLSGITFRAAKRLMLSTEYSATWKAIEPSVQHTFLPVFWVQEASQATEEQCNQFASSVYGAQTLMNLTRSVSLCLAALAAVAAVICLTEPLWNSGNAFRDSHEKAAQPTDPESAVDGHAAAETSSTPVIHNGAPKGDGGLTAPLLQHQAQG